MKAQDITATDIAEAIKHIEMEEKMFGQIGSGKMDLLTVVRDSEQMGMMALLHVAFLGLIMPKIIEGMKDLGERPWASLMKDDTIPEHFVKLIQIGMTLAKTEKEEKVTA